jgi:hypothetical protein
MANVKSFPTNSTKRKQETRKSNQCTWCGKKVALKDQVCSFIDYSKDPPVPRKGKASAHPDRGHWCSDCAEKRHKMNQRYLDVRSGGGKKTKAASTNGRKRATKPKAAKRVRKPKPKAKAKAKDKVGSGSDPF